MVEHIVSQQAYAKVVLHCAKYPWATVHGLLLGETKDGSRVRYVDAIPLAHTWTELTPMFDVALQQVQIYAKTKGLKVSGLYVAYEDPEATQLSAASTQLAKTLLRVSDDVAAFVVDAKRLTPESTDTALIPYTGTGDSAQWKAQTEDFALENNRVLATTKRLVAARAEVGIHDFDEHLTDVSLDWLQSPLLDERIRTA